MNVNDFGSWTLLCKARINRISNIRITVCHFYISRIMLSLLNTITMFWCLLLMLVAVSKGAVIPPYNLSVSHLEPETGRWFVQVRVVIPKTIHFRRLNISWSENSLLLVILRINLNHWLINLQNRPRWLRGNARDSHSGDPGFKFRGRPTWLSF